MNWLDVFFVVWAVMLAVGLAWVLWEAVGLVRARRRTGQKGGA